MFRSQLISFVFLFGLANLTVVGQSNQNRAAEDFILEVMAEYKNPLAYFPLRRDIFLPTPAEIDSIEMSIDRFSSPHLLYKFLFVEDEDLKREIFMDAYGRPLFPTYNKNEGLSKKGKLRYYNRKQKLLLNSSPKLGKFLLYNEQFKTSTDLQKH